MIVSRHRASFIFGVAIIFLSERKSRVAQGYLPGRADVVDITAFLDIVDCEPRGQSVLNQRNIGVGLERGAAISRCGVGDRRIEASAKLIELGLIGNQSNRTRLRTRTVKRALWPG